MSLFGLIKLYRFRKKWRRINTHNLSIAVNIFPINIVEIGKGTYGGINLLAFGEEYKCIIGNYCSIGPNVTFILDADHELNNLSTYPFKVKMGGDKYEAVSKGDIIIDDDVWIGYGATILSGVHIAQGAVIAANTTVTKDIPPYAIVAGNPGKIIKYRFSDDIIKVLLKLDFNKLSLDYYKNNVDSLYTDLTRIADPNIIIDMFDGLVKK